MQNCSNQHVSEPKKHKVRISMTKENHCYYNAVTEIVNGILKDEFYLDQCFFSTGHAKLATKSAIKLYNNKRLHYLYGLKPRIRFLKKKLKFMFNLQPYFRAIHIANYG